MIDLKVLQLEIDSLLDNETDESLMQWYANQNISNYKDFLGAGEFINLDLFNAERYAGEIINPSCDIEIKSSLQGQGADIFQEYANAA